MFSPIPPIPTSAGWLLSMTVWANHPQVFFATVGMIAIFVVNLKQHGSPTPGRTATSLATAGTSF